METMNYKQAGTFISAGTLVGMGVGFSTGHMVAYMFLGMGFGYLIFAYLHTQRP